ncbi:hypothetical protein LINPERHAP2_LOCUS15021 [Linum perenne]
MKIQNTDSSGSSNPLFLVGRCLTTKIIQKGAVIGVTRKAWARQGEIDVQEVDNRTNLFVFTCNSEKQRSFAWRQQPYVVSGSLLSLKYWDGCGRAENVCFRNIPLRIHILDIPALLRSETLISQVVHNYFSSLIAIDPTGLERNRWTRAVKVFAEVPASEPLLTECELETEVGTTHKISFKYENIQPLCLYCGRLGHLLEQCSGRRGGMAIGMSGIPSGFYKPYLKAGVHSNSNLEEEAAQPNSEGNTTRQGCSASENSPITSENYNSPSARNLAAERHLPPDSFSRTNSPEFLSPMLQMLFPDVSPTNQSTSPLIPANLFNGFEEEARPSIHMSPMSSEFPRVPPGFLPIEQSSQQRELNTHNPHQLDQSRNHSFSFRQNHNNELNDGSNQQQ